MKKLIILLSLLFLHLTFCFSDCYFAAELPNFTFPANNDETVSEVSGLYGSGVLGFAKSLKLDFFEDKKTAYFSFFVESQFIIRHITKTSKNGNEKTSFDNDILISAGIDVFQYIRPKISYGFLSKDIYLSSFLGFSLPFWGRNFYSNEDNIGSNISLGIEPIYSLNEKFSISEPTYLNFTVRCTLYLDFSRRKRYENYVRQENEEHERQIRQQQEELERQERIKREADEEIAKSKGFSSVDDYYADLKKKEEEKLNKQKKEQEERNARLNELTRDEWEWALRAIMAYKTIYQSGYYPTYDDYTMKYINKSGLINMYQAECLGNLQTRKLIDRADEIVVFIQLCMLNNGGYCSGFDMARIVKDLAEMRK